MAANKKKKKSIGEIIMPIITVLLFFGIPIMYYLYVEEPHDTAVKAYQAGNTAKIQLVLEDKHTEASGDGYSVSNSYFLTLNYNSVRKTLKVSKSLYDKYLVGETIPAEIPNVSDSKYVFVDGSMINADITDWKES